MKNFFWGFFTALVLVGLVWGGIWVARGSRATPSASGTTGSITTDVGNLKVKITSGGQPVAGLEVDLASRPGAAGMISQTTDASGGTTFESVPVGTYSIFFNANNFPKNLGKVETLVTVEIKKDSTAEKTIELKD